MCPYSLILGLFFPLRSLYCLIFVMARGPFFTIAPVKIWDFQISRFISVSFSLQLSWFVFQAGIVLVSRFSSLVFGLCCLSFGSFAVSFSFFALLVNNIMLIIKKWKDFLMLSTESCDISCEPRWIGSAPVFEWSFPFFFCFVLEIIIVIKYKFSFLILTRNGQRLRLPPLYVCDCVCEC